MPRKGYKCVNIRENVHRDLQMRAKETNRTMRDYVEYLLQKEKGVKEGKT